MKKVTLILSILQCLASFNPALAWGRDEAATALLKEALGNMGQVTSYHAKAELAIKKREGAGRPTARIEGDFGVGLLAYTTLGFDGQRTMVILIGEDSYTSADGGKTWHKNTNQNAAGLSQMITVPVSPRSKLAEQGEVKIIATEEVSGTPTIHLRVAAASPVDVWVAEDERAGKVIRKIRLIITSDDGMDFDTTVVYSDFGKPVKIEAPTTGN